MICIVGADGFFGSYMQQHILSSGVTQPVLCLNHASSTNIFSSDFINLQFDLHDTDSVLRAADALSGHSDIRILFLACVHNPDIIKKDPLKAEYINTVCYEKFLNAIKGADVRRLIYASSDTVYGESQQGHIFTENDVPAPINIYGRQKLMAEEITHRHGFSAARYSYMYGNSLTDRKKHFFDEICSSLRSGKDVRMLTDWVRHSLSYSDAAEITYRMLLSDDDVKTVNICADAPESKFELGLKAAEYTGADPSLVIPCTSSELGIFTEKRANEIFMSNTLAKKLGYFSNI